MYGCSSWAKSCVAGLHIVRVVFSCFPFMLLHALYSSPLPQHSVKICACHRFSGHCKADYAHWISRNGRQKGSCVSSRVKSVNVCVCNNEPMCTKGRIEWEEQSISLLSSMYICSQVEKGNTLRGDCTWNANRFQFIFGCLHGVEIVNCSFLLHTNT